MRGKTIFSNGGCVMLSMLVAVIPAAAQSDSATSPAAVSANGTALITVVGHDVTGQPEQLHGPPVPDDRRAAVEPQQSTQEEQWSSLRAHAAQSQPVERQEPAIEPAATESLPLGTPNGLFSARPVQPVTADDTTADEQQRATRSFIATLDPRENPVMRVIGALGLVLILLVLLRSVMKRGAGLLGQGGRPSGVLEILARYPLGSKQSLVLIKLARRVLLVHQCGGQMATLSEVTDSMEVASLLARIEAGSSGRQAQRFRSMLSRFEREHDALRQRSERDELFGGFIDTNRQGQLIDLTRQRPRTGILGKRRLSA